MTAHTAEQIIEATARAIFCTIGETVVTWDDAGPMTREFVREEARAAYACCLRMLREPTDGMMQAGDAAMDNEECDGPEDAWTAMIDARIKELG